VRTVWDTGQEKGVRKMANFNTLIEDIHAYLNGEMAKEDFTVDGMSAANVIDLAKGIATHTLDLLDHAPKEPRLPTTKTVRMSELGEPCLRKLWLKWFHPNLGQPPYAENGHPTLPIKFLYGDYIEELFLFLAKEAGHSVLNRQAEYHYKHPKSSITAVGHIDALIDDYVVDVKSAADVSFNKYKREGLTADNDTFGYRYQLDAYAKATGIHKRAFVFVNKHDGEMLVIDRSYEPFVEIDDVLLAIDDITLSTDLDDIPEKIEENTNLDKPGYGDKLCTVCSYCAFKYYCYPSIGGYIISGRPSYYTTLTEKGKKYVSDKTKIPPPPAYKHGKAVEIRGKGGSTIEDEEAPF
jgi:hypothetical protein